MQWAIMTDIRQIEEIQKISKDVPVLIYKHSTRCSTSRMMLDRLERSWSNHERNPKPFFLDLITFREISNKIAEVFDVEHESPQVLIIDNGQIIYHGSHFEINYQTILAAIKN